MEQQTEHIGDTNKMMTAVEWLIEKQMDAGIGLPKEWREQAKEMERLQIINACESHADYPFEHSDFVEYYNELYGNDTKGKI